MVAGLKILVVDDDGDVRQVTAQTLSCYGFDVRCARNGKEALEALRINAVDLIVTDLRMPILDGLQMVRILREEMKSRLPVIITSGSGQAVLDSITVDNTRILAKPYQPEELLHLMGLLDGRFT